VSNNDPLTIIGGKVTEVTDKALVIEPDTRITLPPGLDASRITVGARVLVRARRIRGHLVAESIILG
jgi:hypothetical protein